MGARRTRYESTVPFPRAGDRAQSLSSDTGRFGELSLRRGPARAGPKEMNDMGIPEVKRTGGCTCRCGACKSQAHCRNIGSGCKVKL